MIENILAIDLGRKTMGVAISRTGSYITPIANPEFDLDSYDENIEYLKDLLNEEKVEHIVIGYPLYPSGDPCKMTPIVDKFILLLNENFPDIDVIKQDERESTKDASSYLSRNGYNMKRQKNMIDMAAACVILERYLTKIGQM